MKSLARRLGIALIVILGLGAAVSEIWPQHTAKILLSGLYLSAGLQEKVVTTSKGPVHYLEGGEGETVVFLHGIFALKEHWVDLSRKVSGDYRVILLDLPGFGENPRLAVEEYKFARQTENILEALDRIGVADFHIAANSMGAQIAAMMATAQPERVQSIAFIGSPLGVTSPIQSDMDRALAKGRKPLVVTSAEDYAARLDWLFPAVPFLPRPLARTWSMNEVSHADINPAIWDAVHAFNVPPLEGIAPDLTQPTLIVWCEEDRIFHVSGAQVLNDALPDNQLITAYTCGHLPMLDRAAETGTELLNFLDDR